VRRAEQQRGRHDERNGQEPVREPYVPPRVTFTRIEAQEALMGICKAPGPPCEAYGAGGS